MTTPAVEFRNIGMRFGEAAALVDINLSISEGEYMVLLGPSGGGKTTLLNILGGFLQPTGGHVRIYGQDVTGVPASKRPTATVFQDYALFPHMSVAANVGFGLKMQKVPRHERDDRVQHMLAMVGLEHAAGQRVHQLSGGQRQRIALARSLVVDPQVLLLDEPLGALDMKLRRQMQAELKSIQKQVGTTFVHVTHDQEEAMAIADTVVVLNNGSIEDIGVPERVYLRPATRFTASFMGESNLLEGEVTGLAENGLFVRTRFATISVAGSAKLQARVAVSIRPEHLHITAGQGRQALGTGTVVDTGFLGTHRQCTVLLDASDIKLKVRLAQHQVSDSGETVSLFIDPSDTVLLVDDV